MPPLILILYGAPPENIPPDEQDLYTVMDEERANLEALGYRVEALGLSLDLEHARRELRRLEPDIVLNVTDTVDGKSYLGYLAPLLLEHEDIAFTGGSSQAIYLSTDKILSKKLLGQAGIPTPGWIDPAQIESPPKLTGRYIVKSLTEDGSIGMDASCVVESAKDMARIAADRKARFGGQWFAEEFIEGREFNVSLLATESGVEVLPVAEITFTGFPEGQPRIVDYAAKWVDDSPESKGTVRVFPPEESPLFPHLRDIARACWDVFGMNGYARVDFRVDAVGNPYVLEVNVNPHLAEDAGFMAAAHQKGLDSRAVMRCIVDDARRRVGSLSCI